MKKKKTVKNNMSLSVSQRVITLLIEEGKMSVDQIAKTIGRSKIFVNRVIRGEARLSAEELGKLTKSISSSLINKISAITMDDVKDAAEKVKSAAENAVKGTPGFTKDALKKTLRETGKILQATGSFLKGLGY